MKTKRLIVLFLSMLMLVSLSLFAFACGKSKGPVGLSIESSATASIEVGQEYTLMYTSDGDVSVTASGGSYNSETKKFSAETAGEYVLTVTARKDKYDDSVATVTITVKAPVDKTPITNALAQCAGLIQSDYTTQSWSALNSAKKDANDILAEKGKNAEEIQEAADNLVAKINALKPVEIVKAVVSDSKISYANANYFADDVENYDEVKASVAALNANTEIKLVSKYKSQMEAIVATIKHKLALSVTGAPDGKMIVHKAPAYVMSATSDDGASIACTINGTAVEAVDGKYSYAPASLDESFEIKFVATKGDRTRERVFSGSFIKTEFVVNSEMNGKMSVENNVIKVAQKNIGWGAAEGKKVTLPYLTFSGNFSVSFDVKFTDAGTGNNDVMALFFNGADGSVKSNWVAVLQHSNVLETAVNGGEADKVRLPMSSDGNIAVNKVVHVRVLREIIGDKSYITAQILDDSGRIIFVNDSAKGNDRLGFAYVGGVQLGINAENTKWEVSNLAVGNDTEFVSNADKLALQQAINAAEGKLAGFADSDFVAETLSALKSKLATAKSYVASAGASKAQLDAARTNLEAATDALAFAEISKVEINADGTSFVVGAEAYNKANYTAASWQTTVDGLVALNANSEIKAISKYNKAVKDLVDGLVYSVTLTVSGAPANGKHLVATLPEAMTLTATTSDNLIWKVGGVQVSEGVSQDGKSYTFTPAFGSYKIEAVATRGEASKIITFEGSYAKTNYAVNSNFTNRISVENNVINVNAGGGWDEVKGRKVVLDNIYLVGEFTVTYDLKFIENAIGGLFFHENGSGDAKYYVIFNNGSHFMGIGIDQGGGEPHHDYDAAYTANNTVAHVRVSRVKDGDKWLLKGELLSDSGEVLTASSREGMFAGKAVLGIQSENGKFTISNVRLSNGATMLDMANLNKAIADATKSNYKTEDYTQESLAAYNDALVVARNISSITSQAQVDSAAAGLNAAVAGLEKIAISQATIGNGDSSFSYADVDYPAINYKNFADVLAKVKVLNDRISATDETKIDLISVYDAEIKKVIAELEYALNVSIGVKDANNKDIVNNEVIIYPTASYVFTATAAMESDASATFTYAWKLDGEAVNESSASYAYTHVANEEGKHVVEVTVTYGSGDTAISVKQSYTINFSKANVHTHKPFVDNRGATVDPDNGTLTLGSGAAWGVYEGRKLVFDDLVFNGSFSVEMDVKFTAKPGGANVVTIHLLNADTLSRNSEMDNATVGYGCICLQENPVRLETGGTMGKLQSNDGAFSAVASKLQENAAMFAPGAEATPFRVRLTVYKAKDRSISYDFAVKIGNEWVEFSRPNAWGGDWSGGFIVGSNIENAGVVLSNYKFTLLDASTRGGKDCVAGSVNSKADLYNKLNEYGTINYADYSNGAMFRAAMREALDVFAQNKADTDYKTALTSLETAHTALVAKTAEQKIVSVSELDAGYTVLSGISSIEAKIADGSTVTDISWSYSFVGTAEGATAETKTATGATLTLANGSYSNVVLSYKVGDATQATEITYHDFKVKDAVLKSNTDKVVISDENVMVTDGAGWGPKDQLVYDLGKVTVGGKEQNIRAYDFEATFTAKYTEHGGGYRVMCINIFGERIRAVFGWQRADNANKLWCGFDNGPNNWATLEKNADTTKFDYLNSQAAKFGVKLTKIGVDEYRVTITAYNADGTVAMTSTQTQIFRVENYQTDVRFTFENVNLTMDDFTIAHN